MHSKMGEFYMYASHMLEYVRTFFDSSAASSTKQNRPYVFEIDVQNFLKKLDILTLNFPHLQCICIIAYIYLPRYIAYIP